ncbi:MAG: TlpA disulfide reductase family protein [bacterium]
MPNKLVRLIVYSDQFSKLEKTIASTYTNESGEFDMEVDIPETTFAFLALELKKGEFYLKPGATYSFFIPYDTVRQRGSVFDELPLRFTLESEDEGLNRMIGEFNQSYNEFVISHTNRIYRSRDKTLVLNFAKALTDKYASEGEPYLLDYMKYTIASLEWVSKIKNEQEILEAYFDPDDPVLYKNIQYTTFFTDFFKAMFGSTHLFNYDDMTAAINSEKGYVNVEKLLNRSERLSKYPEVRELVASLLLAKKYYSPDIRKDKVLSIFTEIEDKSVFPNVKLTARNYRKKLTHLEYGSPAPPFRLKDAEGAYTTLAHFEGKFVLLSFQRADCPLCLDYMSDLDALTREFKGELQVLTLVDEEGFRETVEYARLRSFDWPILTIGKQILVLEEYNIRAYPAYVIINPDNTIATANAPLPEEGLSFFIRRFRNQYQRYKEGNTGE